MLKILFYLPGGLGNAVMAAPALKFLNEKEAVPFSFLIGSPFAEEYLKRAFPLSRIFYLKEKKEIKKQKFDIFIAAAYTSKIKSYFLGKFLNCAKIITGSFLKKPYIHEVYANFKIIQKAFPKLKLSGFQKEARLFCSFDIKELNLPSGFKIGIHAGSDKILTQKRASAEVYAAACGALIEKYDAHIFLFGSKTDKEQNAAIVEKMKKKGNITDLTEKLCFDELCSYLKSMDLFLSNDSGLAHLAACFNLKQITLFGPTLTAKNKPFNPRVAVLSKNLNCSPCYEFKRIKCKNNKCMDFKADDIVKAAACVIKK